MEQVRTYEEAVKIIVEWWIKKSFLTPFNQNIGEEGMLQNMMNQISMKSQGDLTVSQIDLFNKQLTKDLMLEKHNKKYVEIFVDYNIPEILHNALQASKINKVCIPAKSNTRIIIETNQVETKHGYGSETIVI